AQWTSIAAGNAYACGIAPDSSLWCWGPNNDAQLGDGTQTDHPAPEQIGGMEWAQIAASYGTTCGIKTNGTLWCWGYDYYGTVGDGCPTYYIKQPTQIGTDTDWTAIAMGGFHACALRGGEAWCWGYNQYGEVGGGTGVQRCAP